MKKIAINGFGRIGRAALKIILDESELQVIAVNDLMTIENAAYLFKYDSVYGRDKNKISVDGSYLRINDKKILFVSEKAPENLPWKAWRLTS
jgi:glyceraldehyde 3-phosphate dehydrogenase